jgi:tRNA modification GTPase
MGVVRVSGPRAHDITSTLIDRKAPLAPRHATLARFRGTAPAGPACEIADEVIVTFFPAPRSYTTQDVVEISAHGSSVVLRALIEAAIGAGARLARPGEFTLRAYLGGRMDLTQAEAVADLIASATPMQARAASEQLDGRLARAMAGIHEQLFDLIARLEASLDFPDEGYHFVAAAEASAIVDALQASLQALVASGRRGRLLREGVTVALVGRPNTGKSSLFNRLVGMERAIVAASPGTTRDVLTEDVDLGGLRATVVDTAGVRSTTDEIEAEGVRRAKSAGAAATATLVVLDLSTALGEDDRRVLEMSAGARVVVANKRDLPHKWDPSSIGAAAVVSARTGEGVEDVVRALHAAVGATTASEEVPLVTNIRHVQLLASAEAALGRASVAMAEPSALPEEFVLTDLHEARHALEQVVGTHATDDLLEQIFSKFCIGK